jgi:hypothetical protein
MVHGYVRNVERSSRSSRDFLIFLGLCVAALAAAVIWLAVHEREQPRAQVASLKHQVEGLRRQVDGLQLQLSASRKAARALESRTAVRLKAQEARLRAEAVRSRARTAHLSAHTTRLAGEVARLAQVRAQVPRLVSRCLAEVQQEIDDLRGAVAFGSGIHRRVTSECSGLLRPRYGG